MWSGLEPIHASVVNFVKIQTVQKMGPPVLIFAGPRFTPNNLFRLEIF